MSDVELCRLVAVQPTAQISVAETAATPWNPTFPERLGVGYRRQVAPSQ